MASRFGNSRRAFQWLRQCNSQLAMAGVSSGALCCFEYNGKCCFAEQKERMSRTLSTEQQEQLSSTNMRPNHLSSWKEGTSGLVSERVVNKCLSPMALKWPNMNFVNPDELVQGHIIINDSKAKSRDPRLAGGCVRANACKDLWWDASKVRAGIVTCGGLCPGLNSITREVTNCLHHDYGVKHIMGFQFGYNGLAKPMEYMPINLTPENVRDIHMEGGSFIKCGRGGFDAKVICDNLVNMGVNMLFVVGGDGTQYAGYLLSEEAKKRGLEISIVGVPKSIDNDVLFFGRTFGFDTSVASASTVIQNAKVEACSCDRGVGIVKLMGRDAGFVAMHASLASNVVDLCLIPEVDFDMEEVHKHIAHVLDRKGHVVIAIAEGAGQRYVATGELDATGHTKYGDIGQFLKKEVDKRLAASAKGGRSFYIEPSYIIRSVPIGPNDHIYCSRLAHDAVHTAMRGYTGVCVGGIHDVIVALPSVLIASGKKKVNVKSSNWQSCVQICKMPKSLTGFS